MALRDLSSDALLHVASYLDASGLAALSTTSLLFMNIAMLAAKDRLKEYYPNTNIAPSFQCLRVVAEMLEPHGLLTHSKVSTAFEAWVLARESTAREFLFHWNTNVPNWLQDRFGTRLIIFSSPEPLTEGTRVSRAWLLQHTLTAILDIHYDKLKGNRPFIDADSSHVRPLEGLTRKDYGGASAGWTPPRTSLAADGVQCVGMVLWDAHWDHDDLLTHEAFSPISLLWHRPDMALATGHLPGSAPGSSSGASSAAHIQPEPSRLAMAILPLAQMQALLASKGISEGERMHRDEMIQMIMALRETSKSASKANDGNDDEDNEEEYDDDDLDAGFPDAID